MFEMYLKKRPLEIGINYEELANLTKDFASVDIKNICDEAARQALRENTRITFKTLVDTINSSHPSSTEDELSKYRNIKLEMEGGKVEFQNGIGFKKK